VEAVCQVSTQAGIDGRPLVSEGYRWQKDEQGRYYETESQLELTPVVGTRFYGTLDYRQVEESIRRDPEFAPFCGKLMGPRGHLLWDFQPWMVINSAIQTSVRTDGSLVFDREGVEAAVASMRAWVRRPIANSVLLVPLLGIPKLDSAIEIEPGIILDRFRDDEIKDCMSAGFFLSPDGSRRSAPMTGECFGIRVLLRDPILVKDDSEYAIDSYGSRLLWPEPQVADPGDFGDRDSRRMPELADELLITLRLASPHFVTSPGWVAIRERGGWIPAGAVPELQAGTARQSKAPRSKDYHIDDNGADEIRRVWTELKAVARPKKIPRSALRRYNMALDRAMLDDSIVDLISAAESLLLSDSPDTTELSYRLSLRGANFLNKYAQIEKLGAFQLLRAGYRQRSAIAHGSLGDAEVKVSAELRLSKSEFAARLAQILRTVLLMAIDEAKNQRDFGSTLYWDRLVLGE
jgi:hypothetical protein